MGRHSFDEHTKCLTFICKTDLCALDSAYNDNCLKNGGVDWCENIIKKYNGGESKAIYNSVDCVNLPSSAKRKQRFFVQEAL